MTKHNYKLSNDDKKAILLDYQLNHTNENIQAICKKYDITRQSVYDIVNKFDDKEKALILSNSIKDYSSNFTKKANEIIALMLDRIENQIKSDDKIQLSQLVTSLGILYDKLRLNENQSTSNSSININIKIE